MVRLLALVTLIAGMADAANFILPTVSYSEIDQFGEEILFSLSSLGAFAVTDVPGYADARRDALQRMRIACSMDSSNSMMTRTMVDGSPRHTVATRTVSGEPQPLDTVSSDCHAVTSPLRSAIDLASLHVFAALDTTRTAKQSQTPILAGQSSQYTKFEEVFGLGTHLEHFHLYEQPEEDGAAAGYTMHMHTDAGMLIAMTPGAFVMKDANGMLKDSGLYVTLPHGSVVQAEMPVDSVIFMAGEGGAQWLNGYSFRAIPHALQVPWPEAEEGAMRAWYGRMFFPPEDAVVSSDGVTFEGLRAQQLEAVKSKGTSSVGCGLSGFTSQQSQSVKTTSKKDFGSFLRSSDRALKQPMRLDMAGISVSGADDDGGCGDDEILCWMECVDVSTLPCGTDAVCVDTGSNEIVDGDIMCPTGTDNCVPECVSDDTLNSTSSSSGFCIGDGTDMYMDGFNSFLSYNNKPSCINLFLKSWTLDNRAKFAIGAIGVFLLAMVTEYCTKVRREVHAAMTKSRFQYAGLVMSLLHGVQVMLGYLAMLVAMTYQTELFFCVVLGIVAGHYTFNVLEPPAATTDPCCAGHDIATIEDPSEALLSHGIAYKPPISALATTHLSVKDMTCQNCADTVRNLLAPLSEVHDVKVNLETGTVSVTFDPDVAQNGNTRAVEALRAGGFEVEYH